MFGKYILQNFKKHLVGYILIFLLETALICISLIAGGIAFNAMTDRGYIQTGAKEIYFDMEAITAGEIRESLAEFTNALPVPYSEISVSVANMEGRSKFSGTHAFWQYPDYETMCKQLTEGVWKLNLSEIPTKEQFENNELVAIVGNSPGSYLDYIDGAYVEVRNKYDFTDDNHIMIAGREYLVTGRFQSHGVHIFFSSVPDDTWIGGVTIELKSIPNRTVIAELKDLFMECFEVRVRYITDPRIEALLDWRNSAANMMLSALMIFMSVFNILLIFKYIMSSRQRYFAVLRFCGFKKSTCIVYSLAEILIFSTVSSLVSFYIFHFGFRPVFAEYYSVFGDVVFSPGYYIALYGIFLVTNVMLFAAYIAPSLSGSVREELSRV